MSFREAMPAFRNAHHGNISDDLDHEHFIGLLCWLFSALILSSSGPEGIITYFKKK